jgi:hAT family C-terminal dimerisation region
MFVSVRAAEGVIHGVVTARDFVVGNAKQKEERRAIVDIVTNASFLRLLDKAIMILNPIDAAIVFFQSDKVPVSEVFRTFNDKLPVVFNAMDISPAERNYIKDLLKNRYTFMEGDSHAISYLLDPRYLGSGMTPERRVEVEELIFNQPASQTEPSTLCSDYTNFRIAAQEMKQQNSTVYCMIKERKLSVLKFWLSRGDVWPNLQKLAKKVFGLVASSAASE